MDTTDHDPTAAGGGEGTAESSPDGAAKASPHAYDYPAPGGAGTPGAEDSAADARPTTTRTTRAVLRPVPEGLAAPDAADSAGLRGRAPALAPDPAPTRRRRGGLIALLALGAVVLLVLAVGGGFLAVRALRGGDDAAPAATAPASPAASSVEMGPATITEVSTEVGVDAVGDRGSRVQPEGEFVIVTIEIDNAGDTPLVVSDGGGTMELATADGESVPISPEATTALVADSRSYGVVTADGTGTFHGVFDVPVGSEPVFLELSFPSAPEVGQGSLLLGG